VKSVHFVRSYYIGIGHSGDFIRIAHSIRRWVIKHIQAEGDHFADLR